MPAEASQGCAALRSAAVADLSWLYGLARRLVGDRHEAEDVTHDVLVRACERMDPRRSDAEKRAWLKRVLVNHVADRRRRQARIAIEQLEPQSLERLEDTAPRPEASALDRLTDEHVRLAVARLPRRFADALTLVDLEALGYEEAAARLSVRVGTVSSRVTRARLHLRRELWELAATEDIHTDTVCDAAASLLRRHVAGQTTRAEAAFVDAHLAHCRRCQVAAAAGRSSGSRLSSAPTRSRSTRSSRRRAEGAPRRPARASSESLAASS